MKFIDSIKPLLNDRWVGLVFGMWTQACGGISYTFSLYSTDIKRLLIYNQEMIDGLGTAKDIGGNVGIVSGLLIDILSPAWILFIGGIMHLFGYTMLYYASSGIIRPPLWQMCIFIMLGTNGATWFNTAVLVTCIRNFQKDRGVIVGLLKGFIGLSGAIFTQFYTAIYQPDTSSFLFFCSLTPPAIAFLSMMFIKPIEISNNQDENDNKNFSFLYVTSLILAFYLMTIIFIEESFQISKSIKYFFMFVMVIILLSPLLYFLREFQNEFVHSLEKKEDTQKFVLSENEKTQTDLDINVNANVSETELAHSTVNDLLIPKSTSVPSDGLVNKKVNVKIGQDHTIFQAASTEDYWILFFAMGCGTGSGLTAINNLGQMAEASGSKSISAFVSLVSVSNFLGRMISGYVSEIYVKRFGVSRVYFLLSVQILMAIAHLLFASAIPSLLYVASVMVGLAHGAHWTLMVAIASELFGLKHFGAIYNTLSISSTVGSYCLSVKLAGYLYDRQVEAAKLAALAAGRIVSGHQKCEGPECFRLTFLVMTCVCLTGVFALTRLISRTKKLYVELHKGQS